MNKTQALQILAKIEACMKAKQDGDDFTPELWRLLDLLDRAEDQAPRLPQAEQNRVDEFRTRLETLLGIRSFP